MNRQVHLIAYPEGVPAPEHFALVDVPDPVPGPGEVLVAVSHLSMDPFPRLRMRADSRVGPPLPLHRVVDGRGVGRVLASNDPAFAPGTLVAGDVGWQERVALPAAALQRLDDTLGPPERHLSTLGPSGLTAWFTIGALAPDSGQTIVIAPAAGSVGVLAGQLAAEAGARVVGVVSSDAQARFLTGELGFAAAIRHDDADALMAACAGGVDRFLDGVGGALHDRVAGLLNPHARLLLLGFIAGYNDSQPPRYGAALPILFKRARVEGFLLADHAARFDAARAALVDRLASGRLKPVETVWQGLDQAPHAFAALFGDTRPGKQIVAVTPGE